MATNPAEAPSGHAPNPPAKPAAVVDDADGTDSPGSMAHDSMVTVRLSEPSVLTAADETPAASSTDSIHSAPSSASARHSVAPAADQPDDDGPRLANRDSSATLSPTDDGCGPRHDLAECGVGGHESDSDPDEVDWEQLEKTEDEQVKDDETDNSTALLLARLEQENAKLATNPKSVKVQTVDKAATGRPRPPSMAQLRQMMNGPAPPALRYSMLPPPPMTDLEFYAALVKDYQQTAARLPTLLSNKIRKGVPPPLRGVVWQSMSGARDAALEEQYERFSGESSPYEFLIGKDLGRSFPGVDMFRDPEGDGQRMLGRVLKSFSLYDTKIGYCQGLAFLVGPLLMHMPDKQAFCVLVRLMERYDLRACFLPDLSGLHVRICQFRELLRANLPVLSSHLEELQVETAYVSQWFLSFFAVTCPLPMLFRIYDVIFAEGASETLMRVALSLMRKNEARLLACTELEDVMQLLLSRGLWDCYHYDADEFVQDFVSLTGVVTREKLAQLEQGYRESLVATANTLRASDITAAASRFLGRIWASSTGARMATLQPVIGGPSRPLSLLRRSTSKQSLASTLNSMEASSSSVSSSSSTDATSMSRDSANTEDDVSSRESTPVGPKSIASVKTTDDKYLHSQIEDLLTALSELQRNHALVSNELQLEREEREEDRKAVRSLLDGLRQRATGRDGAAAKVEPEIAEADPETAEADPETAEADPETSEPASEAGEGEPAAETTEPPAPAPSDADDDADQATPSSEETERAVSPEAPDAEQAPSTDDLSELLDRVEGRFGGTPSPQHRLSMAQSKSQLRDELLSAKDQLTSAMSHSQELNRRIHDMDQEITSLKEQLRERHGHVRSLHQEKQRLEKQIHGMRARASASPACDASNSNHNSGSNSREPEADWAAGKGPAGGLRELKLGRSKSTPSQTPGFAKRISSLPRPNDPALSPAKAADVPSPSGDHEALLLELVQAKTAEAMAKQEAEEAKQKLEALRKSCGAVPADSAPPAVSMVTSSSMTALGVLGRLTGHTTGSAPEQGAKAASSSSMGASVAASVAGGGFWGWRR